MKTLFVYKYLSLGGVESVLRTRLRHLPTFGIDARCWFLQDLGGRSVFHGLDDLIQVGTVGELMECVRSEGFDLVTSIDTEEILPCYTGDDLPRLVFEAHSAYGGTLENWRILGRKVTAVFVPSKHHASVIGALVGGQATVRVVPNLVGNRFLGPVKKCEARPPDPVLAWLGRIDEHKNWKLFIEIASLLVQRPNPPEFWIVGGPVDPNVVGELFEKARRQHVLSRLRWLNRLSHQRIPALLDLVRESGGATISTSKAESFGMTIVEAMARACPVIVPRQGPFTEFVEDRKTGILYTPGSDVSAADGVTELLADPALQARLSRAGRDVVLERFSPEAGTALVAKELAALFN